MDNKAKKFLFDLLNTDSPSGAEENTQKVWIDYVKEFAHVSTDMSGSATGCLNPDAKFKVMLAGHCDEIAMVVSKIDEKGFVMFRAVGGINPAVLPGLRVDILGYAGKISGIIGYSRGKNEAKDKVKACDELYIDCGYSSDKQLKKIIRTGDYIVYRGAPEILNKKMLVSKALDNKTGAFIVAEVLRKLSKKNIKVGCYGVSTTGEETNLRGAHFTGAAIQPDMAIACDVTFNTDTPGENLGNKPEVHIGKGPTLATGSPINNNIVKLLEKAAAKRKIAIQYELTPDRTYTDADRIMFSGKGVPVALVSLPVRYMHSPIEMTSLDDLEAAISLLCQMISDLSGKEDLRPVVI